MAASDSPDPTVTGAPEEGRWQVIPPRASGQVPLRCWSVQPGGGPPRAGVLVLPEVFGINAWVRDVCGRLAQAGYAALAVPLFARTAPDLELGYGPAALAEGRSHKDRTRAEELRRDVALAADWLGDGPLGCVGFCFGGHVAWLAATHPRVRATASFYGAGVVAGRPGGGPPTLTELPRIGGRLLAVFGRDDPLIPAADVEAVGRALEAENGERARRRPPLPAHRLLVLEGGHGFMCQARDDHRPGSARRGWQELLDLFAGEL